MSEAGPYTIAIDAMGGDHGLKSSIPGLALVHTQHPQIRFMVFGDEVQIRRDLAVHSSLARACQVMHAENVVRNDDKPSAALRASKGTSMRLAIEAVERGEAQAIVSSGNTGALMAMAKMILKPLNGIHRPAIAGVFPGFKSDTIVLDLGANVLVDAENLVQFAVLGAAFAKAHKKIASPTVGLLNVGSEDMKGPDHVRGAAEMLAHIRFPGQYVGFVEGNDITSSAVDVVVTDGYVGNIALKTVEGMGRLSIHYLKEAFKSDPLAMAGAALSYFALKRMKKKVDPRLYNGGVFLGLNGICIKSHGGSDDVGFASAVKLAVELCKHGYIQSVVNDINHLMTQEAFIH